MKEIFLGFLALVSFSTYASDILLIREACTSRIEGEIEILEGKITKKDLLRDILIGSGAGLLYGSANSINVRNSYHAGYMEGLTESSDTSYQNGYMTGVTGSQDTRYHQGYLSGSDSNYQKSSSKIVFENTAQNMLVGSGIGAVSGLGFNIVKKSLLKKRKRSLHELLIAYSLIDYEDWSSFQNDASLQFLNKKIIKRKNRKDLNNLRERLVLFGTVNCSNPNKEISLKNIRN